MYLSCYNLDLRSLAVQKAMRNNYEMHRTVMSAFEFIQEEAPRQKMGVLFRIVNLGKVCKLYVSSLEKPIKKMPAGFNEVAGSPKDISGVLDSLTEGSIFCFDFKVMPAKKVRVPEGKNSKRIYLGKAADREEWLLKKAEQSGFKLLSFTEENQAENRIKHGGYKSIVFKGTLQITDKAKFVNAYKYGIGAEKAFGCGMLLLSRTPS